MKRSAVISYSKESRFFHWFIAVVLIFMLSGSFFLGDLPEQYVSSGFIIHKSIGLTILFLMVLRLIWILHSGKPPLPTSVAPWEKYLSRIVQYSLYACGILMPLSGWIMSTAADKAPVYFGLFSIPFPGIGPNEPLSHLMNTAHKTIAWIFISLIVLHVLGALKHHFIDKDNVLQRMLSGR
ncbi:MULTISPECIES: cytochrome b [unclassified Legionella]|uniref:cytochrome b n=1 Tax=unclassified Legionella TaxID=2622702 RepID=UPI001056CFC1|nr:MULTISPECIES: cytochrome b [unclassified Legionella]MDI9819451.1 cytochrome b [Legionella sp. PL877]